MKVETGRWMQAGMELKDEVFHHSGKRLHWVPLTGILAMKADAVCLCLSWVFVFKFDISLKSRPKKSPLQFFSVILLPESEMENNKFPTISQCKKNPQQLSTKLLRWSTFVTSYQCIYSVYTLNVYTVKMAGVVLMNAYRKYVFQDILFPALRVHLHYSLSLSDLYRSVVPEKTSTWIH